MADINWTLNDSFPADMAMEFTPSEVTATFAGTLPLLQVSFVSNLEIAITLPMLTGEWVASSPTAEISAQLPLPVASFVALTGEVATFDVTMPLPVPSFTAYSQVIATFSGTLPLLTSDLNALSGVLATFQGTLPLVTGTFVDLPHNEATFAITLPLLFGGLEAEVIPITFNRRAIVMHLFSHAVTEYENFNFNSLAHFKEHFLGASEQGLFILGGKDDIGQQIQADIRSGIHDFAGDGVIKLPKEAWMAYRTDGELELDIEVDEGMVYSYVFDKTSHKITEARETLGKGLKERFYIFRLKNVSGSDFDLESLRILGNVISRKRR